jgi:hypothetical protein
MMFQKALTNKKHPGNAPIAISVSLMRLVAENKVNIQKVQLILDDSEDGAS